MHLLDYEAPGLTDQLSALPVERRRQALTIAAIAVSGQISDLEPQIRGLLERAARDNVLSREQVEAARLYAEHADDRYFTLQEQGAAEAVWKNWFAKSRFATALVNLFGGESWQESADAAYELCATQDDKSAFVALLRTRIESRLKQGDGLNEGAKP